MLVFNLFRESYETNVAFLYVSDDMNWGTKNLEDGEDYDLYFVGDGDPESASSVGHDLAICARCNHTIITRGMFSRWAAVLSGGEYHTEYGPIVPDQVNDNIPKPEQNDFMEGLDNLENLMPLHFSDADLDDEVQSFWWDDIYSWITYDMFYWISSFLPF